MKRLNAIYNFLAKGLNYKKAEFLLLFSYLIFVGNIFAILLLTLKSMSAIRFGGDFLPFLYVIFGVGAAASGIVSAVTYRYSSKDIDFHGF